MLDTLADSSSIPPDLVAIFDLSNLMRAKRLLRHDDVDTAAGGRGGESGGDGCVGEHSNKKAKAHHHDVSSSSSDQQHAAADAPKTPNSALVELTSTLNSTSVGK